MTPPSPPEARRPFTEYYAFTGPTTAISCDVEWDAEQECYHAHGSGFHGTGDTEQAAALSCFEAWLTNKRGWYKP